MGVLGTSMFGHAGHDLTISTPEGVTYLIKGFFTVDHPPSLVDAGGATVSGEQAVVYAGPANVGVYAQAGGAGLGAQIGSIRSMAGTGKITHADGTSSPLKVGAPLFANDTIDTGAGSNAGIVMIDGTTLAVDAKAELVLDELIYDPNDKAHGKETVSLVKGAASFVSGQIAHAGQDHMMFKTPVATIGIRGTHVIATYDPVSGDITIINRPVPQADGSTDVGHIALFSPTGQLEGEITDSNGAWQFNPSKGQTPQEVVLTEAQVQTIASKVESMVSTMVQQNFQNQQNNGGQQGGGQGQGNQGNGNTQGNQGNQGNGTQGNPPPTPPPPHHDSFNANGTQTGDANTANTGTTTTTSTGDTGTTTTTTNTTTTPPPPTTTTTTTPQPVILPTQVNVAGDGATDPRTGAAVAVFTITRVNNITQTTTVSYTTVDGTAHAGTDYMATTGSVTFAPGDTTATVSVPLLVGDRTVTAAENFSLAISGGGSVTAGAPAIATLAAPPPLPTATINSITVSDSAPGTALLTVTLTGNTTVASSVHYATADGTAVNGVEYTPMSGTINFAAGQTTATVSIPILPESNILSVHTAHGAEAFTVNLSQPTGAVLGAQSTGTVTVAATPVVGQAAFSVSSASVNEGGTANITITRGGDTVGQVSVAYATHDDTAHAGADYTAASGVLTFGPGQTSQTITIPTVSETGPEPARDFTVVLSNPDGGTVSGTGTGTVNIAAVASPVVIPTVSISGTSVDDFSATTATFTVSLSAAATNTVTVHYSTVDGTAIAGTNYTAETNVNSNVVTFAPGQTSQTITVPILADPATHSTETFTVQLSDPSGSTLGTSSATGTLLGHVAGSDQLINGNFDANSPSSHTAPLGWTFTPASTGSDFFVAQGPGYDAFSSPNSANFGATGSTDDELSQVLSTVAGQQYTITFELAHDSSNAANDFSVYFGGQQLLSLVNQSSFGYTLYSYTVTATSASTVLAFYGRENPAFYDLDNVTVQTVGAAPVVTHEAPYFLANATVPLAPVDPNNPAGTTVANLFNPVVIEPTNDATLAGVVVIANSVTNATTQGNWQYSTDGTNWTTIGAVSVDNGLVLSSSTLVRFVPVNGFNGDEYLQVRAIDSTFGPITVGATIDPGAGGGTTSISSNFGYVTADEFGTTTWQGAANGDWTTSANWTNGIPESGGLAVINSSSVILSSEGAQTISGLDLTGGTMANPTTLTIESFAVLNVFDGTVGANSTINVINHGTLETEDVLNVTGSGAALNVGITASGGTLSGSGAIVLVDHGTINAGTNSTIAVGVVVGSGGQLIIADAVGVTENGHLTIRQDGLLLVVDTVNDNQGAVFTADGPTANAGTIVLTVSAGIMGFTDGATLHTGGGTLDNLAGGVIDFATNGAGQGSRLLSGHVINEAGGTIVVNYSATYDNGILDDHGTITIAADQQFAIGNGSSGTTLTIESGAILSHTGGTDPGKLYLENGVDLELQHGDLTVPTDITLQLGDVYNSSGVAVSGNHALIIDGTAQFNNADFSSGGNLTIASTGTVQVEDTTQVLLHGTTTIQSGGRLQIATNGDTTSLYNNSGGIINNSGLIELTANASENGGLTLNSAGGTINNLSGGVIQVDVATGPPQIIEGNLNNSGGAININHNATYSSGTLANSGSIALGSGTTLTISGSGIINNTGSISGAEDASITVASGGALNQTNSNATIGSLGEIVVVGSMDVSVGTISTVVDVNAGGTVTMGDGGLTTTTAGITINTDGTLNLAAGSVNTAVYLNDGVSNFGTAYLTSLTAAHDVTLDMSSSNAAIAFTNESSGILYINNGTGGGGARTIIGTIANSGLIDISADMSATNIASSAAVTLDNSSGGTFHIESGATVDFQNTGTGTAGALTNESGATLTVDGTLNIINHAQLIQAGGTIAGGGALNFAEGGVFQVADGITATLGVSTVNLLAGGQLIILDATGTDTHSTDLTVTGTLNDNGTIVLTTTGTDGSDNAHLFINGTLNVQSSGVVEMNGSGTMGANAADFLIGEMNISAGGRFLVDATAGNGAVYGNGGLGGQMTNSGLISVASGAALTIQNGSLVVEQNGSTISGKIINSGDIKTNGTSTINLNSAQGFINSTLGVVEVTSGSTLNVVSSDGVGADTFTNAMNATGLMVDAGAILIMNGNNLDNEGTLTVNGTLYMGDGSSSTSGTGATYTQNGTVNGSGTIHLEGANFSTNNGSVSPGNSPGHLTIDGDTTFGAGTDLQIQLAGTAPGQFDVFSVTEHFTLGGTLDVQSYHGFMPQAGDSFNVSTWGSMSGMFDAATGLVFGGVALDPVLNDTGLTLVARTVTQQAGDGDVTLTGSTSHDNVLVGGSGNDTLIAGPGSDLLIGGSGNTVFVPGTGNDHIVGGLGTNTVDYSSQPGPITVNLAQGTASTSNGSQDTLIGIQNVTGTPYADTIVGNAHDNVIDGDGGADTLTGGGGHTTFQFDSPAAGGATITNFVSGRDIFNLLQSAFGLGSTVTAGQNFSTIATAFNGTSAGVNAAFAAAQPTLVFSTHDDALYYDSNGSAPGYTLIAHVEPGAVVAPNDIHLFHGVAA